MRTMVMSPVVLFLMLFIAGLTMLMGVFLTQQLIARAVALFQNSANPIARAEPAV